MVGSGTAKTAGSFVVMAAIALFDKAVVIAATNADRIMFFITVNPFSFTHPDLSPHGSQASINASYRCNSDPMELHNQRCDTCGQKNHGHHKQRAKNKAGQHYFLWRVQAFPVHCLLPLKSPRCLSSGGFVKPILLRKMQNSCQPG